MRPRVRLLLVLALVAAALVPVRASSPIRAGLRSRSRALQPAYHPSQVIVKFGVATSSSVTERAIRDVGGVAARRSAFGGHYLVTLEPGVAVADALARFRAMPEVEYAERNGRCHAFFTPNDRYFTYQWNFRLLNAPRTWDIQEGDSSVVVAVVDTGIAYEDFGEFAKAPDWGSTEFVPGYDFVNLDDHANDDEGHGTHVASTIAEGTNNDIGVAGLAFKCKLMPVKVLDSTGSGYFFDVADGIDFAAAHGAKVINLSLGGEADDSTTVSNAVNRAIAAGAVVVAAAGNHDIGEDTSVSFPASLPNVIAVGAVDGRKQLAPYSNFGPEVDVVAPGGDFDRDDDNDTYPDGILQQSFDPDAVAAGIYDQFVLIFYEGTSQATPHVAALAALLIRQGITDPAAVKAAIESTAEDLGASGRDNTFGYGLIRPVEALSGKGINQ